VLKRHIENRLKKYLSLFPVTLITGARQSGKTTLLELISRGDGFHYYTFDNPSVFANAKGDPARFVHFIQKPAIIDEVQRVPEIFLPIKHDVDRNRENGRYLLTGSANPLLLPKCGDSLAGRMGILSLFPFSQGEIRRSRSLFIETLFAEEFSPGNLPSMAKEDLVFLLTRGSFPPTISFKEDADIQIWIESYLRAMIERDVRDIANITGIAEFPRLIKLLAYRSSSLINFSEVSRTLGMANITMNRYLRLLETLFFVFFLPAWFTNRGKRLTKSPKIHLCDTAFLSQLLDVDQTTLLDDSHLMGQFLETFVFTELKKLKSYSEKRFELYHFRNGTKEVDFVIERSMNEIYGIEVKASMNVSMGDAKGLVHLREITKEKFKRGLILYPGNQIQQLSVDIWAVPIQILWHS